MLSSLLGTVGVKLTVLYVCIRFEGIDNKQWTSSIVLPYERICDMGLQASTCSENKVKNSNRFCDMVRVLAAVLLTLPEWVFPLVDVGQAVQKMSPFISPRVTCSPLPGYKFHLSCSKSLSPARNSAKPTMPRCRHADGCCNEGVHQRLMIEDRTSGLHGRRIRQSVIVVSWRIKVGDFVKSHRVVNVATP